jgi:MHS family alpha-ketoglutarate permease-like MFS transporter
MVAETLVFEEGGVDGAEPAVASLTPAARLRAIFSGSVGNLVQWYDWYAYSAAALYFAPVFFPKGDRTAQLLQTAAVFAVGFFARPIGAWLMGLHADKIGRKAVLKLSVAMMCAGSLIIAFTPGAVQIGVAAPLILLAARILQGLSLGGEYGASATYISEMAGRAHRGFWSSFNYVTLIGGQLVALVLLIGLQHTLSKHSMAVWGWRVPFVVGALLAILAYRLRATMEESQSFAKAKSERAAPARTSQLLSKYPRETLVILGLTVGGTMMFYVYTTYIQKFLTNTAGFSTEQATEISAAALVAFMVAQPIFGAVSDRIGRKPMLALAFGGGALATWPLMTAIAAARVPLKAFALILVGMLIQTGYTSISSVVKAELFPTQVRALGVGLPYAVANALFGGTAEYVALWFKSVGRESGFYIYACVLLLMGFFVVLIMPDTRKHSRIRED